MFFFCQDVTFLKRVHIVGSEGHSQHWWICTADGESHTQGQLQKWSPVLCCLSWSCWLPNQLHKCLPVRLIRKGQNLSVFANNNIISLPVSPRQNNSYCFLLCKSPPLSPFFIRHGHPSCWCHWAATAASLCAVHTSSLRGTSVMSLCPCWPQYDICQLDNLPSTVCPSDETKLHLL